MNGICVPFEEFYYSTVCHVCKIRTKTLKTCNACKCFRYCSVQHQKLHWQSHKPVCKIINAIVKENLMKSPFTQNGQDWLSTRIKIKHLLERALNRSLTPSENQVWMFPRVCAICNACNGSSLFDCPRCPSVSYCSEEHKLSHEKIHSKVCSQMELQYRYYCNRMMQMDHTDFFLPPDIINKPLTNILNTITNEVAKAADANMNILIHADKLSHVFSLLNAMQTSGLMNNFTSVNEKWIIHVVGATFESLNFNRAICEAIFHWITNLESIEFVFIGPELDHNTCEWDFCNNCQKKNVNVEYEFFALLYSQYAKLNEYKKPDIILIFNCGFHEFVESPDDLWKESLPLLILPNIPLFISSYTYEESVQDLAVIKRCLQKGSYELLASCERNKYCSPIPLRDWINTDDVYFVNYYFSIIRPKGR